MRFLSGIIACFLCVHLTLSAMNVDIVVLPSPEFETNAKEENNYDEAIKTLSNAAKQNSLYVIAHLLDKIRCQRSEVVVRNNLVFDRDGAIVSSYRKPVHNLPNCTTSESGLQTFTTDFGVTFGLLMEEDLVLHNVETMKGIKNFIVVGEFAMDIPFLSATRWAPAWAFITDANLISSAGVYFGKAGNVGVSSNNNLVVAELNKDQRSDKEITPPIVSPSKIHTFPGEDLSQYILRPLNLEISVRGHKETVCHGSFCCSFDVKTRSVGSPHNDFSYGLAVFNGVQQFSATHHVGAQTCAIVACAGLYKRTCSIRSSNDLNVHFDKLSISANFTSSSSAQFPIIVSADASKFKFDRQAVKIGQEVSLTIGNAINVWSFGIFGRNYALDFEDNFSFLNIKNSEGLTSDVYEYLCSEEVIEFFDYLWIRLRILFVVVSIYFLEMM